MKVREKVKLVIAAVTTVCLLSQTFFVGAASENLSESKLLDVNVEYISARNNMVFSGTMAKKKTEVINVLVAAYGKDVLDFASDSSEEVILKTEKTGGGGEINITLELPERIRENGRNAYHIFGSENRRDGMVFTLESDVLHDVVEAINSGASDSVAKIAVCPLNDGKAGLEANDIAGIGEYIVKAKPAAGYTDESFLAAYLQAEGFLRMKKGIISVDKGADEYSIYIGKDLWKKYSALDASVKSAFDTALKNYEFNNVTDLNKIYDDILFVAECIASKSSVDLKRRVIDYFSKNNVDLTDYNNLPNDTRREAVFDAIYAQRGTIKSISDVKELFAAKVAAEAGKANDIGDKVNHGGSYGGGGGGSYVTSTASPTMPTDEPKTDEFGDMANHWAREYAVKLLNRGIINGFPDGNFRPDQSITRAEFAKMVVLALGLHANGADLYPDVISDSWYYSFVAAATEVGLINGDGNGFLPDHMIARQDAATILARAMEYKNKELPEFDPEFRDSEYIADYARNAVKSLCGLGIITGDNGAFRPADSLTRAEASALFVRFCDFLDGNGKTAVASGTQEKNVSAEFKIIGTPIKLASLNNDALIGARLASTTKAASVQTKKDSARRAEAETVLAAVADGEQFFDKSSEGVTRGEFLHAILCLVKKYYSGSGEQIFSDVPVGHKYANDVKIAADLQIISRGDTFRPDDMITADEAKKLMISAIGYSLVAEYRGGYPAGYRALAGSLGFTDGTGLKDDKIPYDDAVVLLFNLLSKDIKNIKYEDNGNTISYTGGESNLLKTIYHIYRFEGMVTAVGNHSMTMDADYVDKENYVEIDGVGFELNGALPSMLGKNVTAYISDDDSKDLVCISEKDNREISIKAKDFESFDGKSFQYYDGDRKKTLNVKGTYKVIYNGRRIANWEKTMADEASTQLRFLDNDDDGSYDVLFVDTYSYGILTGVDYRNMNIGIKFEKEMLDLSDSTSVIKVYDSDGKEIELFRLASGMAVAIKEAADKKFYEIYVCDKNIAGSVTQIAEADKTIYIDGTAYSCSNYFCNKYVKTNLVNVGQNVSLVLGMDDEVVELSATANKMNYAYLVSVAPGKGLGEKAKVRLYASDGEMKVLNISDKTKVDGAGRFDGNEVYEKLIANSLPYVIRYGVNAAGEINSVDFAEIGGGNLAEISDPANSLRQNYSKRTLTYRSGCTGFNSYALLKGSIVMFVPEKAEDLTDEEKYQVGTSSLLNSNVNYSTEIYDIDENGNAGLAIIFDDLDTDPAKNLRVSYIIEEVNKCIKDGEQMRELVCYGDKKYTSLYLPNDVKINKTSGNDLVPGDIIRCRMKNDLIQSVYVDFDFSSGSHVFDSRGGASFGNRACNGSLEFVSGKVYSLSSGNLILSSTTNADGSYQFALENLMPYSIGNAEFVCFDKADRIVTPIDADLIHGYLGYGDNADLVIMRQGDATMKNVYIIR